MVAMRGRRAFPIEITPAEYKRIFTVIKIPLIDANLRSGVHRKFSCGDTLYLYG